MLVKIAANELWKSYATEDGVLPVLAGVDFEVAEGEFVTLVGPSGCGKTTLPNRSLLARSDENPLPRGPRATGAFMKVAGNGAVYVAIKSPEKKADHSDDATSVPNRH